MTRTSAQDLQEELLTNVRKGQEAIVNAIRTWAETVRAVTLKLPGARSAKLPIASVPFADKLLSPQDAVDSAYGLAEQLLANQRQFAEDVLKITAPLMPGNGKSAPQPPAAKPEPVTPAPKAEAPEAPAPQAAAPKAAAPKAAAPRARAAAPRARAAASRARAAAPRAAAAKAAAPKSAAKTAAPKITPEATAAAPRTTAAKSAPRTTVDTTPETADAS